jgi:hypothetical protein
LTSLLARVERSDKHLAAMRVCEASRDGLSDNYKALVNEFASMVATTEQAGRVAEVHFYLSAEVLARTKQDSWLRSE